MAPSSDSRSSATREHWTDQAPGLVLALSFLGGLGTLLVLIALGCVWSFRDSSANPELGRYGTWMVLSLLSGLCYTGFWLVTALPGFLMRRRFSWMAVRYERVMTGAFMELVVVFSTAVIFGHVGLTEVPMLIYLTAPTAVVVFLPLGR